MTEERPPIIVIERNPELDNEESINIAIGIDHDASEQEMMAGFVALFDEMMKDEDLLHAFMGGLEVHTRMWLNAIKRRNGIPQHMGILFHVLVDGSVKAEPHAKDRYTFFRVKDDKMAKLLKSIRSIPVTGSEVKP